MNTESLHKSVLELFSPGLGLHNYADRASRFARSLLACDITSFAAFTPATGELRVDFDEQSAGLNNCLFGFACHMAKYPFTDFDPRSSDWKPFVRADFLGTRAFRDLDVYVDGFKVAGISDHGAIPIRTAEGRILYLGIERCGGGLFVRDDTEILQLMQPHLENARALAIAGSVCPEVVEPAIFANKGLSVRECEVLHWMIQGKSNGEISAILQLRVATVKSYVFALFNKLGVSNRHAAILSGLEMAQRAQFPADALTREFTRATARVPKPALKNQNRE